MFEGVVILLALMLAALLFCLRGVAQVIAGRYRPDGRRLQNAGLRNAILGFVALQLILWLGMLLFFRN